MHTRFALLSIILLLVAPSEARAQSDSDTGTQSRAGNTAAPRKVMRAVRVQGEAPRIDGRLEDAVWRRATFAADFTAKQPVEGAEPRGRTEIAFVYDDDAIYVGARMFHGSPDDARKVMTRRDSFSQSEVLIVAFDSFLDRRTAYTFAVTPAGGRTDYFQPTDGEMSRDYGYNPVWEAATEVDAQQWTAEMRIPFSQIRFLDVPAQTWGLNIDRWIPWRNEDIFWVMIPHNETGWSSRFGDLIGIEGVRPSRRLEVLPYVASSATLVGEPDASNPFEKERSTAARVGGDVKVGLGPSLTLEATINPDFGQVEADPAEVNLSAFETIFEERRPFFAEGADVLNVENFFNSRRIGAPPRGLVEGDYIDRPENSTILGAAKLSGRLPGRYTVGALGAVTGREYARTFTTVGARHDEIMVEPLAAYGVLRGTKQFGGQSSTVGGILTGVLRDLETGSPLADELSRVAITGTSDWNLRFSGGAYEFSGRLGFTHVAGDAAAIQRVQKSSAHFIHRPDQTHFTYDSTRTSLSGMLFLWRLQKNAGRHWLWEAWGEMETPGFEKNDIGRLRSADDIDTHGTLRYRETRPGPLFYSYSIAAGADRGYNFGGVEQLSRVWLNPSVTFLNYWNASFTAGLNHRTYSDALTRGGPLMGTGRGFDLIANLSSNNRLRASARARLDYRNDELGGWMAGASGGVALRPNDNAFISIDPRFERLVDARQYVTTITGGRPQTFGNRYIFSFIDRSTISTQIRLNYFFTPNFTFELYAEPFVSSGRYYDFGELLAPRSRELRVYGNDGSTLSRGAERSVDVNDRGTAFSIDNPDFNVRSFRSSAVMRWEWRPGSTLFLVWQQRRSADYPFGDPARPNELWSSFTDTGNHYFVVKASYWLPIS